MVTYEELFDRVLRRIPDEYDKRQGSVIWLAVASTIAEIVKLHGEIEYVKGQFILDNVTGDRLTQMVKDRTNIDRLKATHSLLIAELVSDNVVPLGTRFTGDELSYELIEHVKDDEYLLVCEQAGEVGNSYLGRILPISSIRGLKKATIVGIKTPGYDEETDDSLRVRYYEHLRLPATSGNEAHYKIWAKEVEGVGEVKVDPLWDGPGTVKVVIIDNNLETASEDLIDKTYKHIESKRPVGANVTVTSAKIKTVKIQADVDIADGRLLKDITRDFEKRLESYRKDIAFKENYISYAKIGSLLLSIEGVLDYSNLKINDDTINIDLDSEEVPVFEVSLNEM